MTSEVSNSLHNTSGNDLKAKHTPGPWKWEVDSNGYLNIGRDDQSFHFEGHVIAAHKCPDCEAKKQRCLNPTEANAHLIAAAPELLGSLKGILHELRQHFPGIENPVSAAAGLKAEYLAAADVIAKAEGRQP